MIRLNAFIEVSAEKKNEVLSLAKELVAYSLKDKGCKGYDIFESATRPSVLMFCETWADAASLEAHSNSKHFTTIVPKIQSLATMTLESFECKK